MTRLKPWAWIALLLTPLAAHAADEPAAVEVREPYVELHTSPAQSYPVFDIAERGERLLLLKRQTVWYKVRTQNSHEGWVHLDQLRQSLTAAGYKKLPPSRDRRAPAAAAPPSS